MNGRDAAKRSKVVVQSAAPNLDRLSGPRAAQRYNKPSVSQGAVSWQAQSEAALGILNGLTPSGPCKQSPHFINLSPRGNSFPA